MIPNKKQYITVVNKSFISVGLFQSLTVAFVVLKLCEVIDWSWMWVTCLVWIPLVLMIGIVAIIISSTIAVVLIMGIVMLISYFVSRKKDKARLKRKQSY